MALCYEAESRGVAPAELLGDLPVEPHPYTVRLVEGVTGRAAEIDALIARHSTSWALDRMPAVDRSLLRLSTYELLGEGEVPFAVVIDEAVELAKEYSTEDSGRFVNGVLSSVATEARPGVSRAVPGDEARPG